MVNKIIDFINFLKLLYRVYRDFEQAKKDGKIEFDEVISIIEKYLPELMKYIEKLGIKI